MIYDIYYDESKQDAYWHGFYFVPKENREYLLNLLYKARENCNYFSQIHYQKIKKRTKFHHGRAVIKYSWTSIGVAAMQQQKYKKVTLMVFLGKTKHKHIFHKN